VANKTTKWWCDSCGQEISSVEDGWVEWISLKNGKAIRGLRLVHHQPASPRGPDSSCQYDGQDEYKRDGGVLSDLPFNNFSGANGLMMLLTLLKSGLSVDDFIAMAQRLHIPGYERARFHAVAAKNEGVFEPNLPPEFYWQKDIERILEWADENELEP